VADHQGREYQDRSELTVRAVARAPLISAPPLRRGAPHWR
jgi:hypothetical protein